LNRVQEAQKERVKPLREIAGRAIFLWAFAQ
jgi:hypothetical protein